MDGGGITISTGQLIALIVFGATTITALLKVIQRQYEKQYDAMNGVWSERLKELQESYAKRMSDQQSAHELRVKEILDAQKASTSRLDSRIKWLEDRDTHWREQQATYISTLEKSVDVQAKQMEALTALANRQPVEPASLNARRGAKAGGMDG